MENQMIPVLPGKPRPFKDQQRSMTDEIFLTTNKTNFQARMGSGFAGEFHCWFYSCSFAQFAVQIFCARTSGKDGLIGFPSVPILNLNLAGLTTESTEIIYNELFAIRWVFNVLCSLQHTLRHSCESFKLIHCAHPLGYPWRSFFAPLRFCHSVSDDVFGLK